MSERTTPITVHLTDEQMDDVVLYWGNRSAPDSAIRALIRDAIRAQRPRPIAVGDRVKLGDGSGPYTVEAIKNDVAWLWAVDRRTTRVRHTTRILPLLTHVDDEATA